MNSSSLFRFVQLFTLTDTAAAERLTTRLALVLRDSAAYQAQYAEELAERDIVAELPAQELRDVALIDGLLSEDLLWESDWQDPAADTAEGLNDILTQQKREGRLRLANSRSTSGPDLLDAAQDVLEPLGLALVLCSLDSDSYPLSIVADEHADDLRRLAQELSFTLTVY